MAKRSEGRISLSTAYRCQQLNGEVKSFDAAVLEALCDVPDVKPGELLVRDSAKKARRHQRDTCDPSSSPTAARASDR
ncbi:MAG: helix-turn-helix domain-containing protein, partial [Gemmatimonadales bacterium]|nr:helix-turn-helix domain-containing protein [Gemmatimonadales bacterium]